MIGDIDIDIADRDAILNVLKHRVGSIHGTKKHNTGVYFQDIPYDPIKGHSTLDHKDAARLGYYKLDILNVHFYNDIKSEQHLEELMEREPNWDLFKYKDMVDNMFHLRGHFDVVKAIAPRSIEDLALVLAAIRPSKRYLLDLSREELENEIWKPAPNGAYYFKRSHAISYAVAVIVHLNLTIEQLENTV